MSLEKDHYFRVLRKSVENCFSDENLKYISARYEINANANDFSPETLESLLSGIRTLFEKENFNVYFHTISKSKKNKIELVDLVSGKNKYNIKIIADIGSDKTEYKIYFS